MCGCLEPIERDDFFGGTGNRERDKAMMIGVGDEKLVATHDDVGWLEQVFSIATAGKCFRDAGRGVDLFDFRVVGVGDPDRSRAVTDANRMLESNVLRRAVKLYVSDDLGHIPTKGAETSQ